MEEKRNQLDDLLQFVTLLETEGEDGLNSIIEETQTLQEKLRAIEFTLNDKKNTLNDNLFFFSPVGVLEEKDEDRELQTKKVEIQTTLLQLNKKLGEYKFRKGKLEAIRAILLEKQEQLRQREEAEKIQSGQEAAKQSAAETAQPDNKNKVQEQKSKLSEESGAKDSLTANAAEYNEKSVLTDGWRILEIQENVRNRIAADLHDSTVQALTSLVHKTEFCLLLMDTDPVRVRLELQKIIDTIKMVINETRDLIFSLHPMNLNKNNLSASIEAYCLQIQKTRSIDTEVEFGGQEPELIPVWKMTLYRIFQEAVGNIVQHSAASKMKVSLLFEENQAHMVIKDNGKGFDTVALKQDGQREHHFGISLMKERTILLNGSFELKSAPGEGTTIDLIIPYKMRKELLNASD